VTGIYHEGSRALQDRFGTRRLADRLEQHHFAGGPFIDERSRAFIESIDMFFIATADAEGRPVCSYKGGEPGFVRVLDERTIAFPGYDGNGMFKSFGNLLVNPHVGLLFISFERQKRLRLNGTASIDPDDPLVASWQGATLVVRVRAREVFPNCPRYIHRMQLVERSRYVPVAGAEPPVPEWKTRTWARDVLPSSDQASRASVSAPSINPRSRSATSP
jgi:predicted pyridoxine 5'-phosphate oxidase superfamily flavin-nucleotide-binding protein